MNPSHEPRLLFALAFTGLFALPGCGDAFEASGSGGNGSTSATSATSSQASTSDATATASSGSGSLCKAAEDACSQCTYGHCEADYCACVDDPGCTALLDCFADPQGGTPQWQQYCNTKYASSIATTALLLHCAATGCPDNCGAPEGQLDGCQECLFRNCAEAMNACLGTVECALYLACATDCPTNDDACVAQCKAAHEAGVDGGAAVVSCAADVCPAECN